MKYSFILPYCNRESFESTLISYMYHYEGRDDYEIIVVYDNANNTIESYNTFKNIFNKFKTRCALRWVNDNGIKSFNSARKYNIGYNEARGEYVVLTSPEIFHVDNILAGLDYEFGINPESYVVCSCRLVMFPRQVIDTFSDYNKGILRMWYQHSIHNNRKFHFCSAMSKNNYKKTGGFDERYCAGIAFEDNSFLKRVEVNNIPIVVRDDLYTLHIEHMRRYLYINHNLYMDNKKLFKKHCRKNDFFEKFV